MKKALVALAAVALVIWVASWFRNEDAVKSSGAKTWPGEPGTLESMLHRYTPLQENAACAKLIALGNALPKNQSIDNFVAHEIERGELTIGSAPPLPDVSPIRELLLRERVVWHRAGGVNDIGGKDLSQQRVTQMTIARALVASALAKAGAHDATGWYDLRAASNLAQSLDPQPEVMSQTAALSMRRMINAVAWKMPLPAPAWFRDVQQRDAIPRLLEAYQYQIASYWKNQSRVFPTKWLADSVEHDRKIAEALSRETRCDVTTLMNDLGADLASVWRRGFRYRAEREATANALRVREGAPIETASRCSDGNWSFDGATLRFSREIPTAAPDRAMPLVVRVSRTRPSPAPR